MGIEKRAKQSSGKPGAATKKEHAMMFAIALALIGIVVLKSLEHAAAKA
jgi:hypothetical protein